MNRFGVDRWGGDVPMADLLARNARLAATGDGDLRELPGGRVAVTGGLVPGWASAEPAPEAAELAEKPDVRLPARPAGDQDGAWT